MKPFPRQGAVVVTAAVWLLFESAVRVDAFLAASSSRASRPAPHAEPSQRTTPTRRTTAGTSRRRSSPSVVTMSSSARTKSEQGASPPREEGKRRTPQQIAEDGQSFLSLALDVIADTGVRTGALRTSQAARATAATAIDVAMNVLEGVAEGTGPIDTLRESPPSVLRKLCEKMGATYIKVGQFVASSPTLFPADYVKEFQKCLDKTDSVPWSTMRPIIEKDLGKRVTEVFSSINTVPLASASIAQVYAATLKTGEDVVIKVQKPGVSDVLKTDLGFMYITSKLVELVNPMFASRLSVSDIVGDIRSSMLDELDFTKEAANQEIFRTFLKESGIDHEVTAPRVFPEASTKRVLTMERLYGVPLTDLEGIKKVSDNPEATLISALNTWTLSVMNCDFFHADVHAGNLLVLEDGRVAFIDFGIVGRFSPDTWTGVSRLADGVAEENFTLMAEALCEMGATVGPVDTEKFASDLEGLWKKFNSLDPETMMTASVGGGGSGDKRLDEKAEQEATGFLLDLVSVSGDNGLKLPREFGLLIKQQLYFDRYTKILAPTLDPLRDSRMQMQMKDQEAAGKAEAPQAAQEKEVAMEVDGGGPESRQEEAAESVEREGGSSSVGEVEGLRSGEGDGVGGGGVADVDKVEEAAPRDEVKGLTGAGVVAGVVSTGAATAAKEVVRNVADNVDPGEVVRDVVGSVDAGQVGRVAAGGADAGEVVRDAVGSVDGVEAVRDVVNGADAGKVVRSVADSGVEGAQKRAREEAEAEGGDGSEAVPVAVDGQEIPEAAATNSKSRKKNKRKKNRRSSSSATAKVPVKK